MSQIYRYAKEPLLDIHIKKIISRKQLSIYFSNMPYISEMFVSISEKTVDPDASKCNNKDVTTIFKPTMCEQDLLNTNWHRSLKSVWKTGKGGKVPRGEKIMRRTGLWPEGWARKSLDWPMRIGAKMGENPLLIRLILGKLFYKLF